MAEPGVIACEPVAIAGERMAIPDSVGCPAWDDFMGI